MGLLTYDVKMSCENCKKNSIVRIRKGVSISQWMDDYRGKCPFCGCNTISLFEDKPKPVELKPVEVKPVKPKAVEVKKDV